MANRTPLRLLSYNIHGGSAEALAGVSDIVGNYRIDAIALQEANDRESLAKTASDLDMRLTFGEGPNNNSLAWLSAMEIHNATEHRAPEIMNSVVQVDVDWRGRLISMFAVHMSGIDDRARYPHREEINAILRVVDLSATASRLLIGDFNSSFDAELRSEQRADEFSAVDHLVKAGYIDCYRAAVPHKVGYTYPVPKPWLRLDYAFATPDLAVELSAAGLIVNDRTSVISDHYPIWVEFAPRSGAIADSRCESRCDES